MLSKKDLIAYIAVGVVCVVEFLALFHNIAFHPPPVAFHPPTSFLSINVQRELTFNIMMGTGWIGIINTMISFPISLISSYFEGFSSFASVLQYFEYFSVLFLGIFFSSKYYLKKYFNGSGTLLYLSSTLSAIITPITFYSISSVTYYFPGVMAIALMLFDYALDVEKININESLKRGAIAAIGATFGFTDFRGIFFTLFAFFLYSLYFIVIKRRLSYILTWLKIFLFGVIYFIVLNINTIIYIKLSSPFIPVVGVSTVYNQWGLALQHVYPFYTLTGVMNGIDPAAYLNIYHPISIIFGALGTATALSALLYRKPIVIFLGMFVLFVTTYNYVGSSTIGCWIAQTPYVGYLVYIYPTYLPSNLFVAPFYLLLSFTLYGVGQKIYGNYHSYLKFVASVLLIILMASSLFIFYLPVAQSFAKETTVYPPNGVKGGLDLMAENDSGIVLVLGNITLANFYDYFPFITNPAFYGDMNFIWYSITNSYNPAKALSYFGVQYVVFLDYNSSQYYKIISNNPYFKLVYNSSNTQIFYNTLYSPYIINKGIYVTFNFPQVVLDLSKINASYVIIPFYCINNLTEILPYVKGFIGYNVNINDLIPMLINNSSYVISASNIYINQYDTYGWIHQSPILSTDLLDSITSRNPNLPLNLSLNIPNGKYYVYVLPVFITFGPLQDSGWIKISSSNELNVSIDSSVYNVSWVKMGELYIKNHQVHIYVSNVNIVRIVIVPSSMYSTLEKEAASILQERSVISFNNNSTIIKNGTYQPKGYGISVFTNPWMVYVEYAHTVRVLNFIHEFNYYFGTANVYITSSFPKIDTEQISDLPYISLNFILDLLIVTYILYPTTSFTYLIKLKKKY